MEFLRVIQGNGRKTKDYRVQVPPQNHSIGLKWAIIERQGKVVHYIKESCM